MSDNEKRAHDLALLVVDKTVDMYLKQMESEAREAALTGVTAVEGNIDYYERYKRAYEEALNAFNNDFPSGKQDPWDVAGERLNGGMST